jgi:hypothetical protein
LFCLDSAVKVVAKLCIHKDVVKPNEVFDVTKHPAKLMLEPASLAFDSQAQLTARQ